MLMADWGAVVLHPPSRRISPRGSARPNSRREHTISDRAADRAGRSPGDLGVFRALAETAPDAVLVSRSRRDDPTIRIEFANEAFCRLTGYDADELDGRSPGILVGEETDLDALRRVETALRNGREVTEPLVLHRRDQSSVTTEARYIRHD